MPSSNLVCFSLDTTSALEWGWDYYPQLTLFVAWVNSNLTALPNQFNNVVVTSTCYTPPYYTDYYGFKYAAVLRSQATAYVDFAPVKALLGQTPPLQYV